VPLVGCAQHRLQQAGEARVQVVAAQRHVAPGALLAGAGEARGPQYAQMMAEGGAWLTGQVIRIDGGLNLV
jgi:hypothetical protein